MKKFVLALSLLALGALSGTRPGSRLCEQSMQMATAWLQWKKRRMPVGHGPKTSSRRLTPMAMAVSNADEFAAATA